MGKLTVVKMMFANFIQKSDLLDCRLAYEKQIVKY
ncbi:hypothetical protein JOC48_002118 [Aquibacillus albus]|uniref:Uncharacterized protein n=1 Tax=Aquibacillus albus TaxID=1168171 RepID=A0ABS2N0I3_9BACI|nr:hypothetical protein [Aquibacillus albus]